MMEITSDPERLERAKTFVNDGLASGSFKPLVAKTFPLDQIVEAHRYLDVPARPCPHVGPCNG